MITVTDELNAYKVFETLNARGVRLSATDLLKNYLFSVLHRDGGHEQEMKNLEDRWEAMVGRLGSESFPDFLRVHWNSRHAFVRQTELFKTIRNRLKDREAVFGLIRTMEEDLDIYPTVKRSKLTVGFLVGFAGPFRKSAFDGAQVFEVQRLHSPDAGGAVLGHFPGDEVARPNPEGRADVLRDGGLPFRGNLGDGGHGFTPVRTALLSYCKTVVLFRQAPRAADGDERAGIGAEVP